jgi:hypothetical protein
MPIPSFNAKLGLALTRDRLYRIYARGGQLYFLRISGQGRLVGKTAVDRFGAIGELIGDLFNRRSLIDQLRFLQAQNAEDPAAHLADHPHNFRLSAAEISESSLEPRPIFAFHGHEAGRWLVRTADGRSRTFYFQSSLGMRAAAESLPHAIGAAFRLNVEWDESRKKFRKRR